MTRENCMKFKFQNPSWNTAPPTSLSVANGCLPTTMAELSSWDKDHVVCKA